MQSACPTPFSPKLNHGDTFWRCHSWLSLLLRSRTVLAVFGTATDKYRRIVCFCACRHKCSHHINIMQGCTEFVQAGITKPAQSRGLTGLRTQNSAFRLSTGFAVWAKGP